MNTMSGQSETSGGPGSKTPAIWTRWSRIWLVCGLAMTLTGHAKAAEDFGHGHTALERPLMKHVSLSEGELLSSRVGARILEALESREAEDPHGAILLFSELLESPGLSPFEQATVLSLRGETWHQTGNITGTIEDFTHALRLQVLPPEQANSMRINTAILLLSQEDYEPAIGWLEDALVFGYPLDEDIALWLAQAYAVTEQYDVGEMYARQAVQLAQTPERSRFLLLMFYLERRADLTEQLNVIERMLGLWPSDKEVWARYANVLNQMGRETDAFHAYSVMYSRGLLDTENEIIRLVQQYNYQGYPYRGGDILEREINAGRVAATAEHYRLLAHSWQLAREWNRSLPVLRRVATLTGAGEDYQTLAEALYQVRDHSEAEAAYLQALNVGGLHRPGDAWLQLGVIRQEQGKPQRAMLAFEEALAFEYSRAAAQGWVSFIQRRQAVLDGMGALEAQLDRERCALRVEEARRGFQIDPNARFDTDGRPILNFDETCLRFYSPQGVALPERS